MEIELFSTKTIKQIQEEFNSKYPYLKLEFYRSAHKNGEASPKESKVQATELVGQLRSEKGDFNSDVHIHSNMKVSTLEQMFQDKFGLNVQVFRKSGDVWLQTTKTDNWSLSEQNETAREFSELR